MHTSTTEPKSFRTLGRSGLVVSPFALGTMTFGAARWGADEETARAIFAAYIEGGGNFIDTADVYADGQSEELVGKFIAQSKLRDFVVVATKAGFNMLDGNPNGGGNGRKHLASALDASLRRLGTDYIDLFYTHVWDGSTPVLEVLQTLGDFVRSGKIRYFGFSDAPAWYSTKAATLAAAYGIPGPIAMQPEYSLIERSIELEHVPAARECGLGVCVWGPLAAGFLSGKYTRTATGLQGAGRFETWAPFRTFSEQHWQTLATVEALAAELSCTPSQVALAWAAAQPGITSLILGASKPEHVRANLTALALQLTAEQVQRLDDVSALPPLHISLRNHAAMRRSVFGDHEVHSVSW